MHHLRGFFCCVLFALFCFPFHLLNSLYLDLQVWFFLHFCFSSPLPHPAVGGPNDPASQDKPTLKDTDCAFFSKGCAVGGSLLLKQVMQKPSWCDVERESIGRRKGNIQAGENHVASGSDPCQKCHVLDLICLAQHFVTHFLFPFRASASSATLR